MVAGSAPAAGLHLTGDGDTDGAAAAAPSPAAPAAVGHASAGTARRHRTEAEHQASGSEEELDCGLPRDRREGGRTRRARGWTLRRLHALPAAPALRVVRLRGDA